MHEWIVYRTLDKVDALPICCRPGKAMDLVPQDAVSWMRCFANTRGDAIRMMLDQERARWCYATA